MEKQTKEYIFDWVVGFENEALEHMREEVIKTAEFNFGPVGRDVAEKYYRAIDGEEDFDSESIDEECDDCKKRAQKIAKNMQLIQYISAILLKDSLDQAVQDSDCNELLDCVNKKTHEIFNKTCFDLDPTELKFKLLLNACRRLQPNECNGTE